MDNQDTNGTGAGIDPLPDISGECPSTSYL